MLIIANRAPTNLQPLPNRIIDRSIRNNDIASLAECWNHTRDRRESLCVNDASFGAKTRRDVGLRLHVDILRAVELGGSARPDTVCAEGLDGFFFDLLVADEVVEVVGREIRDGPAVGEFYFGSCWSAPVSPFITIDRSRNIPYNDWQFLVISFLERCLGSDERFGSPFVNKVIDLLFLKHQYTQTSRSSGINPPLQSALRSCRYGLNMKAREGIE
jgi:hypothetical protein